MRRAKGLTHLVEAAVEHGSRAVQRVHLGTSARTFGILEQIPGIAGPAAIVRVVHDGCTTAVYATIRGVNKVACTAVSAALDVAEVARGASTDAPDPPDPGASASAD